MPSQIEHVNINIGIISFDNNPTIIPPLGTIPSFISILIKFPFLLEISKNEINFHAVITQGITRCVNIEKTSLSNWESKY